MQWRSALSSGPTWIGKDFALLKISITINNFRDLVSVEENINLLTTGTVEFVFVLQMESIMTQTLYCSVCCVFKTALRRLHHV